MCKTAKRKRLKRAATASALNRIKSSSLKPANENIFFAKLGCQKEYSYAITTTFIGCTNVQCDVSSTTARSQLAYNAAAL